MIVYYITRDNVTMFHWGLFTMKHAAQDVINLKVTAGDLADFVIRETFINE